MDKIGWNGVLMGLILAYILGGVWVKLGGVWVELGGVYVKFGGF